MNRPGKLLKLMSKSLIAPVNVPVRHPLLQKGERDGSARRRVNWVVNRGLARQVQGIDHSTTTQVERLATTTIAIYTATAVLSRLDLAFRKEIRQKQDGI